MRAAARLLAVAAALLLVAAFAFASRTMALLERAEGSLAYRLRQRLGAKHTLAFYAPLDAGAAMDLVTGLPLRGVCAGTVPGPRREARSFDGRKNQGLSTDLRWMHFAERGGTLALWLDLADTGLEQRIAWDRSPGVETGLRLRPDRTLEAVFTDGAGTHALAAPLPAPGRFVPVAFVLSPERAALWVDGREAAAAPVSGGLRMPAHTLSFGTSRSQPLVGAIDELSAWLRPLDDAELAALCASGRALDERLEPWRVRRAAAARALASGFRTAVRSLERALPSLRGPAVLRTDLPELDLVLSKKDERHLLSAHEASLRAGFRTRAATRDRAVLAGRDAALREAFVSLDDAYGPGAVARPSYLLRGAPGSFGSAAGLARLIPPERFVAIHPDAPRALPLGASRFVRLLVDGDFRGLYVLEPFGAPGGAWRASGDCEGMRPERIFFGSLPAAASPAGDDGLSPEAAETRWRETLALLRTDARFPWSGAEARRRDSLHAARRATLAFGAPSLAALDLMGANPSPFYVTNDIALSAAGPGVSWRSSDPATLDAAGHVTRPAGDLPRVVELTGAFPDGSERAFRFRVMPLSPRLPALFLHIADPVRKDRRTDFACTRVPAGGGAPEGFVGTAATGGGLRHRGNTSYVNGARRSLSLEFDRPAAWIGTPEPAVHALLLSGYADPTRLRNALSFDAFAAMRPDGPRGAVPVSWTEVFVNGEYAGVWETVPRLKDLVAARTSPVYKVRTPDGLWSRVSAEMVDRRDEAPPGEDPAGPFLEAVRFVAEAPDAEFAARAGEVFDLDNLADMLLLLNFTGNADGQITNQYVARRRSDGRWVALPWDYDKTFLGGKSRTGWLSNPLYDRCLRLVPGFKGRVAARWAALRAGPLSDAALERWIAEKGAFLEPFMAEDFRLVPPAGFEGTYAEAIAALREQALERARHLDGRFALRP